MAKSISEEELQLKKRARRRLIGAVALVIVTAVFLPMVLEHEPKPVVQNIDIQIPSPDNAGTFTSKIVPVTPPSATGAEVPPPSLPESTPPTAAPSESVAAPAPSTTPTKPTPIKTPEPVVTKAVEEKSVIKPALAPTTQAPAKAIVNLPEKTKPADKPKLLEKAKAPVKPKVADKSKAVEKPKPEAASGGFVVQVAALNDAAKAKQIQQQMTGAGIKTFTEIVPTAKGSVTRVRAGPFKTRDEAEQTRDKLKGIGLTGNVVPK
jgi:DedD protein